MSIRAAKKGGNLAKIGEFLAKQARNLEKTADGRQKQARDQEKTGAEFGKKRPRGAEARKRGLRKIPQAPCLF